MRTSMYFTDHLSLILNLFREKCFFKSKESDRADPNYIKAIQFNWESFVIVRDKNFMSK